VLLIVEVSDTTEEYDRNVKMPMYSRAGIPEAWLVSLPKNLIWVYRQPVGSVYQNVRIVKPGESITVQSVPNLTIAVDEIFS
jgi:Uma2 family endonuclease